MNRTHQHLIIESLAAADEQEWRRRHVAAFANPDPGFEVALVGMVTSLADYADATNAEREGRLISDYVLGASWREAVHAVIGLLNGNLGRLDGGALDGLLRSMLKLEGFGEE